MVQDHHLYCSSRRKLKAGRLKMLQISSMKEDFYKNPVNIQIKSAGLKIGRKI
jgi:hypothetical protein